MGTNILQQTTSPLPKYQAGRFSWPGLWTAGGEQSKSFPHSHSGTEAVAEPGEPRPNSTFMYLALIPPQSPGSFCLFQDTDQAKGF